jgi:hypothetical protein
MGAHLQEVQEWMQLGNPVHWRGKWFWTKDELASNMRFLSELTDYCPIDQVDLTTIIVAQQLGGCKLVGQKRGSSTFYTRARRVRTDSGPRPDGQSEQVPTVWTHLWMNVN